MLAALSEHAAASAPPSAALHGLPPRLRVLYITTRQRTGRWLAEALAADSACEVLLDEALGTAAGVTRLRDEAYDAVLVTHEPGTLDALDLIEGCRAGGSDEPIVVLGNQSEQEMAALCFEVGADGYVCVPTATTRNLLWITGRAVRFRQLARDNHRLALLEQGRLLREHDEADRLLQQQRAILQDLEELRRPHCGDSGGDEPLDEPFSVPESLVTHYRELLRTYVIMGSGSLSGDLRCLAEMLVGSGLTARQAMYLHLRALEDLVHGLGARSTRHVMTRADLLVLELMVHLAEGYRQRYRERVCPPQQMLLPGFE